MEIKISPDGAKNCLVTLSGFISKDFPIREILSFRNLLGQPKAVRIDSAFWLIQEKMGFNLWWWAEEPTIAFPMESRNFADFEKLQSLHAPKGATGLGLSSFKGPGSGDKEMSFLIILELIKQ